MFNGLMAATFQDVYKRDQIAVHVGVGIRQRITYPGLGREVDDSLRLNVSEQSRCAGSVRKVQLLEAELRAVLKLRQPAVLQVPVIVVVHIVHANDFVALFQKAFGEVKTDKASRTSH